MNQVWQPISRASKILAPLSILVVILSAENVRAQVCIDQTCSAPYGGSDCYRYECTGAATNSNNMLLWTKGAGKTGLLSFSELYAGIAVHGVTYNGHAIQGTTYSTVSSGVYGVNHINSPSSYGVTGRVSGDGSGRSNGISVFGDNKCNGAPCTGYAGYFTGRVYVAGWLSKGGGGFLIDDPIEPENYSLTHSFVESPDMKISTTASPWLILQEKPGFHCQTISGR